MRRRKPVPDIPPSRIACRDALGEALAGVLQRPGRSALTMLGTVLGVGAFVAVLGLTATADGAINAHFDALAATEVTVKDIPLPGEEDAPLGFPATADERIGKVNGMRAGGVLWTVPFRPDATPVSGAPPGDDRPGEQVRVVAAWAGLLRTVRPLVGAGRVFDDFHDDRAEPVAVVGRPIARLLSMGSLDRQPAVFVDGVPFTVIGIIDEVRRRGDLLQAVILPRGTVQRIWGEPDPGERAEMVIETDVGAAQHVAKEVPFALRPDAPERMKAIAPLDPRALRDSIGADVNDLFLLLAAICLLIGAVGIANITFVAVLERRGEIGLRRALGARPRHIAAQFIIESTALGTLGGLVGTSLGIAVVAGTAVQRQWTPLLEPLTAGPAPLIGSVVGLVAGLYPARRAARIEPAEALRR